jgi:hypothetical protein
MAIWQCDFLAVPVAVFRRRRGGVPDHISVAEWNRIERSTRNWIPNDHAERLGKLLPEFASWSSDLRWWGSEVGDRIDVTYHEGKPTTFEIRLDVRKINIDLIRQIADLMVDWRHVLLATETGDVVRPTRSGIFGYIAGSHALARTWSWVGGTRDEAASAGRRPVFICHSSDDKAFVRTLARDLKSAGIKVWLDHWELLPGDSLSEKIQAGLAGSSWLLVVVSKHSVKSRWVRRELNAG